MRSTTGLRSLSKVILMTDDNTRMYQAINVLKVSIYIYIYIYYTITREGWWCDAFPSHFRV